MQVGSSIALGVGLFVSTLLLTRVFAAHEAQLSDLLYQPTPPSDQVALVEIDDASLQEIGPWPWPRSKFAELIGKIGDARPRLVATDILFQDSTSADADLAEAIRRVPRFVQPIIGLESKQALPSPDAPLAFTDSLTPAPALQTRNTILGHKLVRPDPDGIVRRVPVAIQISGRTYPALGIAAAAWMRQGNPDGNGVTGVNEMQIPVDSGGLMYLNFTRRDKRDIIPAAEVLRARVDQTRLDGKIVLVGLAASTGAEDFATPATYSGRASSPIEIQADLIETIVGSRWLAEQDRLMQITMIFLLALLAGATIPHFRLLTAAALTMLYFLAYFGYALSMFNDRVLVQPLYPALALVLTFGFTMIYRYFAEDRQRDLLEWLFRLHVPAEVVDQVLRAYDRGGFPLTGRRRQISILHIDLFPFAALAQQVPPGELINMLDDYISRIIRTVFQHGGWVIRQTGQSVTAAWNFPMNQLFHAREAVVAAVEIKQELDRLAAAQPRERQIDIALGISTGDVVAGYVGKSGLGEFAVLGESMAVAARLATNSDCAILIDAETLGQLGEEIQTREVRPVRVRGRPEPTRAWQVLESLQAASEPGIRMDTGTQD